MNWKILLAAVVLCAAVVVGYGHYQYRAGFSAKEQQAELEIAELNEAARVKEHAFIAEQAERDKKQYEEFKDAQDTITQLRTDVASGRMCQRKCHHQLGQWSGTSRT